MICEIDLNAMTFSEVENLFESINNDARINVLEEEDLIKRYTKVQKKQIKKETPKATKKVDWDKVKAKMDIVYAIPANRLKDAHSVARVVGIKDRRGYNFNQVKKLWEAKVNAGQA